MKETKIEWREDDKEMGDIIEDGTIEEAITAAVKEAECLADKLYEIANKYGVGLSINTSDMKVDKDDVAISSYINIGGEYASGGVRHFMTHSKMSAYSNKYNTLKFVCRGYDYEDSPVEAKV